MKPLTECEEEVLVFLKGCERCPSIDEIGAAVGKAKSHIHRVLKQLEDKGFIADIAPHTKKRMAKRMARSLVLTPLAEAHDYNPFHADLTRIPTEALVAEIEQREAA